MATLITPGGENNWFIGSGILFSPGAAIETDPHWSSVRLLVSCDSLPPADKSSFATPITTNTTQPLLDTSIKKFGAASFTNGVVSRDCEVASTNNNVDIQAGQPFTWECWLYFSAVSVDTGNTLGSSAAIMESQGATDFILGLARPSAGASPRIFFSQSNAFSGFYHQTDLQFNTWIHCALVREASNSIYLYADGVKSTSTVVNSAALDNGTSVGFSFLKRQIGDQYRIWMDEIRVTAGVARYTSSFTPPTTAFPTQ